VSCAYFWPYCSSSSETDRRDLGGCICVVDSMLRRRRCGLSDCLTWFCASGIALVTLLVLSILYGTRTESPSLPPLVKEVMPAGRCLCEFSTNFECGSCLDCAANPAILANATGEEDESWVFNYRRDGSNYGLDEDQCQAAFPGLFEDIERAQKHWKAKPKITEQLLSSFELTKGMVRALIYDGQVRSA
jgi:hypothetical protein